MRLRDGRALTLRRSTPDDAPRVHGLERALIADGRGVVQLVDEAPPSPDQARQRLEWFADHPESLHLVAVPEDGGVVGVVDVKRPPFAQLRHNGLLTLGVHPAWQGVGLGRALMDAALAWAEAESLLRVELFVLADNPRAIALYRSLGFREELRRPRYVLRPGQAFAADLLMAREW